MVEVQVNCRDVRKHRQEVDDAIREFKKQVKKAGIMQELKSREHYVAPSKKRRLKRSESLKQRKRDAKKQTWHDKGNDF
jgi:small subunit ribosomal protein S21